MPHVIVVASDARGRIVRYYENSQLAPYFGSVIARDAQSGRYIRAAEPRQIASVGKMIAAVSIANEVTDTTQTLYLDDQAPPVGLETCRRNGNLRRGRRAVVAFACSLNRPLEWRTARLRPSKIARVIDQFGFNMPPAPDAESATPPSTAAVRGLISGSPRRVHHMASVILASLTGRRNQPINPPTLIRAFDFTSPQHAAKFEDSRAGAVRPRDVIRLPAHAALRAFLQAPLCYQNNGRNHGTLRELSAWCAASRAGLRLHFAKTGTAVTQDRDATIDTWIAGGLQFNNGAQYSYVVVVGTGSATEPFAHRLHASQLAVPLLAELLRDLEAHAKQNPIVAKTQKKRRRVAANKRRKKSFSIRDLIERNFFRSN